MTTMADLVGFKRVDGRIVKCRYRGRSTVSAEQIRANFLSCIARRLPYVQVGPLLPQKVAIVAGGPSVVEDLESFRNWDGPVVAINGTHDWLQDNGIILDALILADRGPLLAGHCQHPNDTTMYLVSECCDPSVFDALQGKRVVIWTTAQIYMTQVYVARGILFESKFAEMSSGAPSCATLAPYIISGLSQR
jgi:Protein of unknown function DUF115